MHSQVPFDSSCNNVPTVGENLYVSCNQSSRVVDFEVWHKIIGHIPSKRMNLLPIEIVFF